MIYPTSCQDELKDKTKEEKGEHFLTLWQPVSDANLAQHDSRQHCDDSIAAMHKTDANPRGESHANP